MFPKALKCTKVVPLLEQGQQDRSSSNCPGSLVPKLGKIIECYLKDQLYIPFVKTIYYVKNNINLLENQIQ